MSSSDITRLKSYTGIINDIYKNTKKTWFEDKMWEEYFINGKTYRQIEAEYGLDHCLVFHNVKKIKEKIKNKIK